MPYTISAESPSPRASGTGGYSQQTLNTLDAFNTMYGPQLAAQQEGYFQQLDALQGQYNIYGPQPGGGPSQYTQMQYGFENQNLANQLAGIGLQRIGNQLTFQGEEAQKAFQTAQYGLQQQGFGVQQADLASQIQLAQQQFNNQMASYGIQNVGIGAGRMEDVYRAMQNERGIQQQTAAAGNYGALNRVNQENVNKNQLAYQQFQADQAQQQLWLQMVGAQEAYRNTQVQEFGQQRQLSLAEQGAAQAYQFGQGQIGRQEQQTYLGAQALGLNQQEAINRADQAIAKLGLQGQLTGLQLLQQIGQLRTQGASNLTGIMPSIIQVMQGLGAGSLSGINPYNVP